MRIGILGAGNVGGSLGRKLVAQGYAVMFGVRDPLSPKARAVNEWGAQVGSMQQAASFGEVVVVALPFGALHTVLQALDDLADKIVVDTTNAFGDLPAGYPSAAAAVAEWSRSTRVVKAFNATPWEALADPIYNGTAVETFICGDDIQSKQVAAQLARDVGFEVVDAGGLANAALTEQFARLWGELAYGSGIGRNFAFKIVRR